MFHQGIAMKNLMWIVWDGMAHHYADLDQCVADFRLFGKPDLNVVDAYPYDPPLRHFQL